jgi:hypothetical protein
MTLKPYLKHFIEPHTYAEPGNPAFEAEVKSDAMWRTQKEVAHAHYLAHFVAGNTVHELAEATCRSKSAALAWLKKHAVPKTINAKDEWHLN